MYLKELKKEVKNLMNRFEYLEDQEKFKFIKYVLEEFDNNQINSLNEANPNMLDDSINILIFNPTSIGYSNNLVSEIIKHLEYEFYLINQLYQKNINSMLSGYEKLSFENKIDVVVEIILFLENKDLLLDYLDGYEIARSILNYKKLELN